MHKEYAVNLSKVYMDDEIKKTVLEVLDSGWFIHGKYLKEFEEKFAKFVGTKFAIGVSSGTAAIHVALKALGVGEGDEVILPSHTAFPTAEPLFQLKARPVFVDIDPETYTLSTEHVKAKITRKTKGIIPVHLYGHPADMDPILEVAEANNLFVLEDSCQAHGAEYKKSRTGSLGTVACFSFYPSKNMTVCGDGGMVTTDDPEVAEKIQLLRNHGMKTRYKNIIAGYNYRLSEISAAIGIKQLEKLPSFNEHRRKIAKLYSEHLQNVPIELPVEKDWAYHVYHLYVIRTRYRTGLQEFLKQKNITTEVHYPIPVHLQPATSVLSTPVVLPVTEKYVSQILSLPMHPQLTENEVEYVCCCVREGTAR
jgi:perosamine synthetase